MVSLLCVQTVLQEPHRPIILMGVHFDYVGQMIQLIKQLN